MSARYAGISDDGTPDLHPLPLTAGSSLSHETIFQPWEKRCRNETQPCTPDDNYVEWKTFVEWMRNKRTVEFEFITDIYGLKMPATATCKVRMPKQRFDDMVTRRWASPVCLQDD